MTDPLPLDCQAILENISAYLDGDLDATACDAIARHCQQCPRCADVVESLRATIGLCRQVASASLPESVRQRARERVRRLLDPKT
jgi:anti-sigma factor RsiW